MKKVDGQHIVIKLENHKIPEFIEKKRVDWIYYGEKNDYPDYLIGLFTRNATHNAIVTGKTNFILGNGIITDSSDEITYKKSEAWLSKANPYESWEEVCHKIITDLELFNGYALEVIWGGGKPLEYYHIDFSKIRTNEQESEYYYCDDWRKSKPQNEDSFKIFAPFNPEKGSGSQLIYFKVHRPSMSGNVNVYPMPDYVGAVADIETDIEITNFHYNNVKNGFSAGTMVNFNNGVPTQEKIDELERKFKAKFSGTDEGGNIILTWNDSKEREATVVSLQPNNLDKQFKELAERIQQNIFTGHKVTTPMLFGVKTPGQLGGRTELMEGWEHFKNTYVKPRRRIIEGLINILGSFSGLGNFKIAETEPIGFQFSENTIAANLSKDEIRAKIGYEPEQKPEQKASELIINAINSLSPLVANKVLEAMTPNEIRGLAALPQIPEGNGVPAETPQPTFRKFTKEDDERALKIFDKYGTPSSQFVVLKEKRVLFKSNAECQADEFLTIEVSNLETKIIEIIKKDPLISADDLAKALKISVKDVSSKLDTLQEKGLIKSKDSTVNDQPVTERTITDKGKNLINKDSGKVAEISLVYQYKVKPGLGPEIIPTTRDFCRGLIEKDKKYTRKEIEQISDEVGYSVWAERGGWYTNPKTGITTPFCRHVWVQQVVIKK